MTLVQMKYIQTNFLHMNMVISIAPWWKHSWNECNCQICGNG